MDRRLDNLRQALRLEWGELCTKLDVGRVMMHYIRSGERTPSMKLIRRIEAAEAEAGLRPAAAVVVPDEALGGLASLREPSSELRKPAALRREFAALVKLAERLSVQAAALQAEMAELQAEIRRLTQAPPDKPEK